MKTKGSFLWQKNLNSPVVAVFLLGKEGLLSVPFTSVSGNICNSFKSTVNFNKIIFDYFSDDVLTKVLENAKEGTQTDFKLL